MLAALTALGVFTVIVLILLVVWVASFLSGGSNDTPPLSEQSFGLTTEATAPENNSPAPAPAAATVPVASSAVTVFSPPQGTPDQPATAKNAIDGNPATAWSSDSYFQPFPSLKNGVGLMVTLADAANLKNVAITSDSPGTVVEIRSAPFCEYFAGSDQGNRIGCPEERRDRHSSHVGRLGSVCPGLDYAAQHRIRTKPDIHLGDCIHCCKVIALGPSETYRLG